MNLKEDDMVCFGEADMVF